jgi:hypothetical protein
MYGTAVVGSQKKRGGHGLKPNGTSHYYQTPEEIRIDILSAATMVQK